jgi:hypothetical protein
MQQTHGTYEIDDSEESGSYDKSHFRNLKSSQTLDLNNNDLFLPSC